MPRNKSKAKKKRNYIVAKVLNPPSSRYGKRTSVSQSIINYIINYEGLDFANNLKLILKHPAKKIVFNAYSKTSSDILNKPIIKDISVSKLLDIYACFFSDSSDVIEKFVANREIFERHYWQGEYQDAERVLQEHEDAFGVSVWLLQNKILILSAQEKNDELRDFCNHIKHESNNALVIYIIDCAFWLANSSDASITLDKLISTTVAELRESGQHDWAALISLIFMPPLLSSVEGVRDALYTIQALPLIDEYVLLMDLYSYIIAANHAESEGDENEENDIILKSVQTINAGLGDSQISRMIDFINNKISMRLSEYSKSAIEKYEEGQYENAVADIINNIDGVRNPLAYINILSKASAYAPEIEYINDNPLNRLINKFIDVYMLNKSSAQSIKEIKNITIKTWCMNSSKNLLAGISKLTPMRLKGSQIRFVNSLAVATQNEYTALTVSLQNNSWVASEYANNTAEERRPVYRRIKSKVLTKIKDGCGYSENIELISKLKDETPLKKDYIELLSRYLIESKKCNDLISLAADMLVGLSESYICLPMEKIVEHIESHNVVNRDSIIVLFYYSKFISNAKDYLLNETFEDYFIGRGVSRPSEIFEKVDLEFSAKDKIFYFDICLPDIMDFLGCFDNSSELLLERIKIVSHLGEKGVISGEVALLEFEKCITKIIIGTSSAKIGSSKVYVDTDAIIKSNIDELSAVFDLYRNSEDDSNKDYTVYVEGSDSNESLEVLAIVSGTKNSLTVRMIETLLNNFLYDENYGLDKNLSTEIRHGFFKNTMLSKPDASKLLTELNKDGKYENNEFWIGKINLVYDHVRNDIDDSLKKFTNEYNDLINEAQEWMKITTYGEHQGRVFNFNIDSHDMENVQEYMDSCDSVNDAANYIFEIIWDKTEGCLQVIREKLNIEFQLRANEIFNCLRNSVNNARGDLPLTDLMETIDRVRNEVREDLETASTWFYKCDSVDIEDLPLNILVDTAIHYYSETKGCNPVIKTSNNSLTEIPSEHVKPLVLSIINCLDNALEYGDNKEKTLVTINTKSRNNGFELDISNSVDIRKANELAKGEIENINSSLKTRENLCLMRQEGGTGLYKVYNQLKHTDSLYDMSVSIENNIFTVGVTYGM